MGCCGHGGGCGRGRPGGCGAGVWVCRRGPFRADYDDGSAPPGRTTRAAGSGVSPRGGIALRPGGRRRLMTRSRGIGGDGLAAPAGVALRHRVGGASGRRADGRCYPARPPSGQVGPCRPRVVDVISSTACERSIPTGRERADRGRAARDAPDASPGSAPRRSAGGRWAFPGRVTGPSADLWARRMGRYGWVVGRGPGPSWAAVSRRSSAPPRGSIGAVAGPVAAVDLGVRSVAAFAA